MNSINNHHHYIHRESSYSNPASNLFSFVQGEKNRIRVENKLATKILEKHPIHTSQHYSFSKIRTGRQVSDTGRRHNSNYRKADEAARSQLNRKPNKDTLK